MSRVNLVLMASAYCREKDVKAEVIEYYKNKGYEVHRFTTNLGKRFKELLKVSHEKGKPDLVLIKDGEFKFVEVKGANDGLRMDQLKWIIRNREFLVEIVYIDPLTNYFSVSTVQKWANMGASVANINLRAETPADVRVEGKDD